MDANDPSSTYKEAIQSDTELQNGLIYLEYPDHNECIHAVNEATAQATGHFLVLITSQDIMPRERIECCMDFFERTLLATFLLQMWPYSKIRFRKMMICL